MQDPMSLSGYPAPPNADFDIDMMFPNADLNVAEALHGPKLEGSYAHQVGLSELRVLSSGTTAGTVLKLAMDLKDGDEVAVRLMTRGPGISGPGGPLMPHAENALPLHAQLHHSFILGLKRVFLTDHHLGIVYQYATHGNVASTLETYGRFTEKFARFFFQQLTCALHFCHEQGIAHGNVKLRNMFLRVHSMPGGEAPVLKLGGFEHAKVDPFVNALAHPRRASSRGSSPSAAGRGSRSGSRSTSPGTVFTPRGTAIQQSKAADVWACGVALYTMLTHADPFDPAMLAAKGPRVPPSTAQGGSFVWPEGCVPSQSCQDLVEQMLQPDTNARITTEGIMQHPWFLADLPRELMSGGRAVSYCQIRKCPQPLEEIKELLRQAKQFVHAF